MDPRKPKKKKGPEELEHQVLVVNSDDSDPADDSEDFEVVEEGNKKADDHKKNADAQPSESAPTTDRTPLLAASPKHTSPYTAPASISSNAENAVVTINPPSVLVSVAERTSTYWDSLPSLRASCTFFCSKLSNGVKSVLEFCNPVTESKSNKRF